MVKRKVTSLVVRNKKDEKEIELAVDGVFVEAGGIPTTAISPKDTVYKFFRGNHYR